MTEIPDILNILISEAKRTTAKLPVISSDKAVKTRFIPSLPLRKDTDAQREMTHSMFSDYPLTARTALLSEEQLLLMQNG